MAHPRCPSPTTIIACEPPVDLCCTLSPLLQLRNVSTYGLLAPLKCRRGRSETHTPVRGDHVPLRRGLRSRTSSTGLSGPFSAPRGGKPSTAQKAQPWLCNHGAEWAIVQNLVETENASSGSEQKPAVHAPMATAGSPHVISQCSEVVLVPPTSRRAVRQRCPRGAPAIIGSPPPPPEDRFSRGTRGEADPVSTPSPRRPLHRRGRR